MGREAVETRRPCGRSKGARLRQEGEVVGLYWMCDFCLIVLEGSRIEEAERAYRRREEVVVVSVAAAAMAAMEGVGGERKLQIQI